jgi:hypothetical protein
MGGDDVQTTPVREGPLGQRIDGTISSFVGVASGGNGGNGKSGLSGTIQRAVLTDTVKPMAG